MRWATPCIADLQTENREHYQGTEDNNIVIIYLSLYCILYVFFLVSGSNVYYDTLNFVMTKGHNLAMILHQG